MIALCIDWGSYVSHTDSKSPIKKKKKILVFMLSISLISNISFQSSYFMLFWGLT